MGLMMWFLQRLTALCMALYATFVYMHFAAQPFNYISFRALFESTPLAVLFVFTVLAMSVHAWIGVWTVATDYLKCSCVRYTSLTLYGLLLMLTVLDTLLFLARI